MHRWLERLLPPILCALTDMDSRVRYYGCEALYNVGKVARSRLLPFFNAVFEGLCRLSPFPPPRLPLVHCLVLALALVLTGSCP